MPIENARTRGCARHVQCPGVQASARVPFEAVRGSTFLSFAARTRPYVRYATYLLVFLIALSGTLRAQRFTYRQYGAAEGLSTLTIRCLLQDREGYIWVGSENGLFQYDGRAFTAYKHEAGLPDTEVLSLAQAPDGTLWVGTPSGLARSYGKSFKAVGLNHPGGVDAIAFDAAGQMFLLHKTGILRGLPQKDGSYRFENVVPGDVDSLFVKGSRIWFGEDRELWELRGNRIEKVGTPSGLPADEWKSIVEDSEGNLWVRSSTRLFKKAAGAKRFTNETAGIPETAETHLFADRHGRVFVSGDSGVLILDKSGRMIADSQHGLPSDAVGAVLTDREESLWFGMYGGGLVRRLGHGEWLSWKREDGLLHNIVWSVQTDDAGNTWVGGSGGLNLISPAGKVIRSWSVHNGLEGGRVLSVLPLPGGGAFVGTDPGGLSRLDAQGRIVQSYGPNSGLHMDRINIMAFDSQHRLWFTGGGRCSRTREPVTSSAHLTFESCSLPDPSAETTAQYVFADRAGDIWLAYAGGVARLHNGFWRVFDSSDGLVKGTVALVTQDHDAIWVAYRDALGMTKLQWKGDHVQSTHYGMRDGMLSDQINAIAFDHEGRVWASTDNGVDVLESGHWRHFGTADGLVWDDTDIRALHVDRFDRVWVGTSNGLSRYSALPYPLPVHPPSVLLTSVEAEPLTTRPDGELVLPFSRRALVVRFGSLDFFHEGRIRYCYRLIGSDAHWHEATGHTLSVSSMPPGRYSLEIRATDPDGLTSAVPARLNFVIRPPWWRTWWFILGAIALIIVLGRAFWLNRVKRLLTQKEQLEHEIAERTAELRQSHKVLERIAYLDSLTMLPNRRLFTQRFRDELASAEAHGASLALLLVDLDQFKQINDTYGHDAGDAVLCEVGMRLRKAVRDTDLVARLGGDEFGMLVRTHHDFEAIERVCSEIITSFRKEVPLDACDLKVSVSIGVSVFPIDGKNEEDLYRSADRALYETKRKGRNGFTWSGDVPVPNAAVGDR